MTMDYRKVTKMHAKMRGSQVLPRFCLQRLWVFIINVGHMAVLHMPISLSSFVLRRHKWACSVDVGKM